MELRHLRYFVAAAEEENISRAALKLHVSQPGVSRQIRDLENEIGVQLFERTAKSLKLTDAGKTLLNEARAVLQHVDEAVEKTRLVVSDTNSELFVGYAPSLTVQLLPPTLREFQKRFPKVRVALHDLSTEEMVAYLRSGKLHVALMVMPDRKMLRGLEFQDLASYSLRVAVPPDHPFAKLKSVSLSQIANEPLISYSQKEYPEYLRMLKTLFAANKPAKSPASNLQIAGERDGVAEMVLAVESGEGIALLPECISCMVGPRLRLIPLAGKAPQIGVIATWKKGALNSISKQFVAVAKSICTNAES